MMTEEIIIDGVNVAACKFYTKGISDFCEEKDWYCADIKDCYFKQIQRLKAENEELKEEKTQLLKDCYSCNFHKYKQALEEIRDIAEKEIYMNQNDLMSQIITKINEVLADE